MSETQKSLSWLQGNEARLNEAERKFLSAWQDFDNIPAKGRWKTLLNAAAQVSLEAGLVQRIASRGVSGKREGALRLSYDELREDIFQLALDQKSPEAVRRGILALHDFHPSDRLSPFKHGRLEDGLFDRIVESLKPDHAGTVAYNRLMGQIANDGFPANAAFIVEEARSVLENPQASELEAYTAAEAITVVARHGIAQSMWAASCAVNALESAAVKGPHIKTALLALQMVDGAGTVPRHLMAHYYDETRGLAGIYDLDERALQQLAGAARASASALAQTGALKQLISRNDTEEIEARKENLRILDESGLMPGSIKQAGGLLMIFRDVQESVEAEQISNKHMRTAEQAVHLLQQAPARTFG